MITPAEWVGAIGVGLLLGAFLLLQLNRLDQAGWIYLTLNFVGASLACLSSYMIDFLPFVILEGVWAASSLVALTKLALTTAPVHGGTR